MIILCLVIRPSRIQNRRIAFQIHRVGLHTGQRSGRNMHYNCSFFDHACGVLSAGHLALVRCQSNIPLYFLLGAICLAEPASFLRRVSFRFSSPSLAIQDSFNIHLIGGSATFISIEQSVLILVQPMYYPLLLRSKVFNAKLIYDQAYYYARRCPMLN